MSFVGKWVFDEKNQEFKFHKYAKNVEREGRGQIRPFTEVKVSNHQ